MTTKTPQCPELNKRVYFSSNLEAKLQSSPDNTFLSAKIVPNKDPTSSLMTSQFWVCGNPRYQHITGSLACSDALFERRKTIQTRVTSAKLTVSTTYSNYSPKNSSTSIGTLPENVEINTGLVISCPLNTPLKSPRPTPKFFTNEQTFSTKKQRVQTPKTKDPPRPPMKSCSSISRLLPFRHHMLDTRPVSISFNTSPQYLESPYYKAANKELLYFQQCFVLLKKIGSGSFGDVYKVRSKEDSKLYAVKRAKEKFKGVSDRERKLEEVRKHELLPLHPNCVQFFRAWEEHHHLYIQIELCEMSLSQFANNNHNIPETIIWKFLVDLIKAVEHLHTNNFLHLDIKPDNIFISQDAVCKLGDFGLVCDLNKLNKRLNEPQEGDPKYLADELMQGIFTKAADVFSLGITILELATDMDLPLGGPLWHELRDDQIPESFTNHLSSELVTEIKLMMSHDHLKRPTATEVLARSLSVIDKHKATPSRIQRWKSTEQLFKSLLNNKSPAVEKTSTPGDSVEDETSKMITPDTQQPEFLELHSRSPPIRLHINVSPVPWLADNPSPTNPGVPQRCKLNFDDDDDEEGPQIGPKNLMDVFDSVDNYT